MSESWIEYDQIDADKGISLIGKTLDAACSSTVLREVMQSTVADPILSKNIADTMRDSFSFSKPKDRVGTIVAVAFRQLKIWINRIDKYRVD